jgi:hypothetical protein
MQNFAARFQTEIARMSSALPSIFSRIFFTEKCTERHRERVIGLVLPSMCNRISCSERETEY